MTEEFNLSKKIHLVGPYDGDDMIDENRAIAMLDVKEFIRLLKEEILQKSIDDSEPKSTDRYILGIQAGVVMAIQTINKLAGEKLC